LTGRRILNAQESRRIRALCAVYVGRLLGLYMVLPVLSPHASRLVGATPLLIGLSLGAYGATQAVFQIPFGYLSDRVGRRRAISIGLLLFGIGSFAAAVAQNAWFLVIARALQGAGAISSVLLALVADLTREEVRTQAMAQVGIWIGAAFAIAFIVGPPLADLFGVPFLFFMTGVAAVLSLIYLNVAVPDPPSLHPEERLRAADLPTVLRHPAVLLVNIGVFLLHTVVTVLFVLLPFEILKIVGPRNTWVVLVPAISVGVAVMALVGRLADRQRLIVRLYFLGAALLSVCCFLFALIERTTVATLAGLLFFVIAIGILEPILASLLSRFATGPHRGTSTGVYSMFQYGGAFFGGVLGGAFLHRGHAVLFLGLFALTLGWGVGLIRVGHLRPQIRPRGSTQPDRPSELPKGADDRREKMREADPQWPEPGTPEQPGVDRRSGE
jgi:MFS family permease